MNATVIIDVGNTAIKVARFENHQLINVQRADLNQINPYEFIDAQLQNNDQVVVAASGHNLELEKTTSNIAPFVINQQTALPIAVHYETPETVGIDRLANATMACKSFPDESVLVVDLGSCITYDLTVGCAFRGGAISPGLKMRARAMSEFTARLPHVEIPRATPLDGSSTEKALQSGVLNGWVNEITAMSAAFAELYPHLQFVHTGGDLAYFEQGLKKPIFADPNWTLKGYYEIYRFNAL